jgi:hypothetical protein
MNLCIAEFASFSQWPVAAKCSRIQIQTLTKGWYDLAELARYNVRKVR